MSASDAITDCVALGQIIDRIADKWVVMVVGHLSGSDTIRFNALMRAIPGVSHQMLTLRGLQRDGIVSRTAFATIPPRVDYKLTPLGMSLTNPRQCSPVWPASIVHRSRSPARNIMARSLARELNPLLYPFKGWSKGQVHA